MKLVPSGKLQVELCDPRLRQAVQESSSITDAAVAVEAHVPKASQQVSTECSLQVNDLMGCLHCMCAGLACSVDTWSW